MRNVLVMFSLVLAVAAAAPVDAQTLSRTDAYDVAAAYLASTGRTGLYLGRVATGADLSYTVDLLNGDRIPVARLRIDGETGTVRDGRTGVVLAEAPQKVATGR